jgi:hypothetical protein
MQPMKAKSAVAVLAVIVLALVPAWAATTSYEWTGYQLDSSQYAVHGTFADGATGHNLTVSLPQWYIPFPKPNGNGYEYPAYLGNWSVGTFCDGSKTPYPTITFQETGADGTTTTQSAMENSITCQTGNYNSGTTQLTTQGAFRGTNNVTGQPFNGTFTITNYKVYRGWSATDVKWTMTY